MVKALFDVPPPALDLFDRLAGDAGAAATNGAERSMLRPLLPYYADTLTTANTGDNGPRETPSPSPEPPMQHQPHATPVTLAPLVPRANEAPNATLPRDAGERVVPRVVNETRSINSRGPTSRVTHAKPNQHSMPPSPRVAESPEQVRSAVWADLRGTEIAAPVARPPVRDSGLPLDPHREHPLPTTTPKPKSFLEPVHPVLRSRDASSVSPLPRPVSLRAEPTIEIHIGRIEVRAQAAASPPTAPAPRPAAASTSSLGAHLGARGRGARS